MKNCITILICTLLIYTSSFGQPSVDKMMFIVDSIRVLEDPEEGNEIAQADIADITVIRNKDALKYLGYEKFDGVTFVFTNEYRKRIASIKQIPSSKQMERKNDLCFFHGSLYSGQFIDYYYSGKKRGQGTLQEGKLSGQRCLSPLNDWTDFKNQLITLNLGNHEQTSTTKMDC